MLNHAWRFWAVKTPSGIDSASGYVYWWRKKFLSKAEELYLSTYALAFAALTRYNYNTLKEYNEVVSGYEASGIPLEAFVADSSYMYQDQDFTNNEKYFPLKGLQVLPHSIKKNLLY